MNLRFNADVVQKFVTGKLKDTRPKVLAARFKGVAIQFYKFILIETPQYSGHMASNLRLSYNGIAESGTNKFYTTKEAALDKSFTPKEKGDSEAVEAANEANRWINSYETDITGTFSFFYANEPDPAYYASVEAGNNLRAVNAPGYAMLRAHDAIMRKYRGAGSILSRQLVGFEEI